MPIPEEFKEDNLEDFPISFICSTMSRQYMLYLRNHVKKHDITAGEHPIIMKLYYDGKKTQHEIAKSFYITEGTIARTVRKLEEKDIVQREIDAHNRRQNYISLTKKGIQIAQNIGNLEKEWEKEVCDLTDDELLILKRVLYKITMKSLDLNK